MLAFAWACVAKQLRKCIGHQHADVRSPEILTAFLNWFLTKIIWPPNVVVAVGHKATYGLHRAAR